MDSTTPPTLLWPAQCWPAVFTAGRFTNDDHGFTRDYANPKLTIHLFSYALTLRLGEHELAVAPWDLVLVPPDWRMAYDIPRAGVHWSIRATPDRRTARGAKLTLPLHHRLGQGLAAEARSRMERVIEDHGRAAGRPDHPAARGASAGVQALLCWLAAQVAESRGSASARRELALRKAAALLAHPECTTVPIAEIAQRAGMSQNRLAAAFRERHGMTMAGYRARQMVAVAQQLMTATDLPLETIARQIDIANPHHFNKLFRRVAGISPSAWRASRQPVLTSSPRPPLAGHQVPDGSP